MGNLKTINKVPTNITWGKSFVSYVYVGNELVWPEKQRPRFVDVQILYSLDGGLFDLGSEYYNTETINNDFVSLSIENNHVSVKINNPDYYCSGITTKEINSKHDVVYGSYSKLDFDIEPKSRLERMHIELEAKHCPICKQYLKKAGTNEYLNVYIIDRATDTSYLVDSVLVKDNLTVYFNNWVSGYVECTKPASLPLRNMHVKLYSVTNRYGSGPVQSSKGGSIYFPYEVNYTNNKFHDKHIHFYINSDQMPKCNICLEHFPDKIDDPMIHIIMQDDTMNSLNPSLYPNNILYSQRINTSNFNHTPGTVILNQIDFDENLGNGYRLVGKCHVCCNNDGFSDILFEVQDSLKLYYTDRNGNVTEHLVGITHNGVSRKFYLKGDSIVLFDHLFYEDIEHGLAPLKAEKVHHVFYLHKL